jgi:hypothetical protein
MLAFKLIDNIEKTAIKRVTNMQKQMAFASSVALNETAFQARQSLNKSTVQFFNAPVKFTQSAFLVEKSNKRNLIATVYAQDAAGKDRARYLRFGTTGGTRPQKGFERFFSGAIPSDGTIPPGSYFMPTSTVKTNRHGNVSQATLRRITKGINGDPRGGFFMGTPRGGNRPPGIYRRSRSRLTPYFIATQDKPDYTARFPISTITQKVVQRSYSGNFQTALAKALATAR